MILDPRVVAAWPGLTEPLEGRVSWMYLDVRGLVTTGLGCLLASDPDAVALPWEHASGHAATSEEIRAEWWAVRAMRPGMLAAHYREPGALILPDAAVDDLARQRLSADAAILDARWGLADWPSAAQAATCALAWAVGAGASENGLTGPTWPHLHAALGSQDWLAAALAGQLRVKGNPGVAPRNLVVMALFRLAAGWDRGAVLEGVPEGLPLDKALRSLAAWDAAADRDTPVTCGG